MINILAKCSIDSIVDYIQDDKMYNIYFITSVNNNNSRGGIIGNNSGNSTAGALSFKINNSITYIKKSRIIKKSLIFLNENDELVIPNIEYDIRYVLIEEI